MGNRKNYKKEINDIYLSVSLSTEPIKPITKTIINKLDLREKHLSKINKDLQKLNKKLEQAKKELEDLRLFRRRTANGKYIQSSNDFSKRLLRFENQSKNFSLASKHKQEYKLFLQEIEITDEIPF
ncbi:hypothetical protein [Helicobacter pylori]|uniref:hypothetical protein n=1 Tax=Helicobacter pylori TaxID=210 RepID=UPI00112CEF4D|nr:hypothetical protein [Helicobacter pylori]TPI04212.1 hypothetical protein FIM41_00980 [Helicobacter pylori]